MTDLNWTYLKENVYFWDGSFRDIYVQNVSERDWGKWTEFVNEKYRIDWHNGKTEKDETKIDFDIILQFWKGDQELSSTEKVFADDIQINAHFFDNQEIENDIDPREFKDFKDHEKLMKYLTGLSLLLNRRNYLGPLLG